MIYFKSAALGGSPDSHLWSPRLRVRCPCMVYAGSRSHSWRWRRQRTSGCPPHQGRGALTVPALLSAVTIEKHTNQTSTKRRVSIGPICRHIFSADTILLRLSLAAAAAELVSSWRSRWPCCSLGWSHSCSLCTASWGPWGPPGTPGGSATKATSRPPASARGATWTPCSWCSCSSSGWT